VQASINISTRKLACLEMIMLLHLRALEVSHNFSALSRIKALTAGQPPACRARECFARGGFMVGELKYVHEPLSRRLRGDGHLDSALERLRSSILSKQWQRLRCGSRVSARLWLESEKLQLKSPPLGVLEALESAG
jgi:hypothetical protein